MWCMSKVGCPNELKFAAKLMHQIIYNPKTFSNFLNFASTCFDFFSSARVQLSPGAETPHSQNSVHIPIRIYLAMCMSTSLSHVPNNVFMLIGE